MKPLYFDIDPTDIEQTQIKNDRSKKEPVNLLTRILDSVQTAITPKNYFAGKSTRKKTAAKKTNDSMILQDFFGALNY